MVYRENFAVAVKWNGNILREQKENVYLPFGSEYSILLKNLSGKKSLVDVQIDGRVIIKGLIVHPNSSVDLERFYETNNKFKFIEKNDDIKSFRGDKVDDGIIRVSYKFEKDLPIYNRDWPNIWYSPAGFQNTNGGDFKLGSGTGTYTSPSDWNITTSNYVNCCSSVDNTSVLRSFEPEGITVEGSKSNQQFTYGSIGTLEENEYVICIKLNGLNETQNKIDTPILVHKDIQCRYCGKKFKSNLKFCGNCGAALF